MSTGKISRSAAPSRLIRRASAARAGSFSTNWPATTSTSGAKAMRKEAAGPSRAVFPHDDQGRRLDDEAAARQGGDDPVRPGVGDERRQAAGQAGREQGQLVGPLAAQAVHERADDLVPGEGHGERRREEVAGRADADVQCADDAGQRQVARDRVERGLPTARIPNTVTVVARPALIGAPAPFPAGRTVPACRPRPGDAASAATSARPCRASHGDRTHVRKIDCGKRLLIRSAGVSGGRSAALPPGPWPGGRAAPRTDAVSRDVRP